MKTTIPPITFDMKRFPTRCAVLIISTVLTSFVFLPAVRAVSPPPDGGYANGNTAEGTNALFSLTSGVDNTALGFNALYHNTTGNYNTANGFQALFNNTNSSFNTATGVNALVANTTGHENTANGFGALNNNNGGYGNAATGFEALFHNTTGIRNTANGSGALFNNTMGDANTANGSGALSANTTAGGNTATGTDALAGNTTGNSNTANGFEALLGNTTGSGNTASGGNALLQATASDNTATGCATLINDTTGGNNTATGFRALFTNRIGNFNTATGVDALYRNTSGSANIALGYLAGQNLTTGSNNIDIGNNGVTGEAGKIRIGTAPTQNAAFVAGISGVAVTGAAVVVNSSGQLGVAPSSERFKMDIKSMDLASEAILALRPVTFRYKEGIDPNRTAQFGLVAEEVERVNPDLVSHDTKGNPYTVRYEAVNAMLLNEFLKEHRRNEEQEATIVELKSEMKALTAAMKEQARQFQELSMQVETSKRASQVALTDHN